MSETTCTVVFPPAPFDVANIGNGPEGFIFNAAHLPAMRASGNFRLVGVCSETPEHAAWARPNYSLSPDEVTTDFDAMIDRCLAACGDNLVLSVTLPTSLHRRFMARAAQKGVKKIVTDKPVCPAYGDYAALTGELASAGAEAVVTFNHNYMNPVLALRALVARVGALNVVNIGTGFLQSWLMTDPKIRQSGWRLKDPYGGLTDIGSHAGMLAAWIMGMDIAAVSGVKMSTVGSHGAQCLDNGTLNIHFPNGLNGTSCFHQALPGHVDDLYAVVSFKDGVLPNGFCHAMFRMEWNPDGIFLSKGDGNIDDWAQWKLQVHAPCELITGAELDLRFTPPGHMEGWPEGWRRMFKAIAGHFWTKLGLQFAAPLAGNFALPAPTLATAGEVSMRYIGAVIKAHTEGLGSVALADVK